MFRCVAGLTDKNILKDHSVFKFKSLEVLEE